MACGRELIWQSGPHLVFVHQRLFVWWCVGIERCPVRIFSGIACRTAL